MTNIKLWIVIFTIISVATYKYAPPHFWTLLRMYLSVELVVGLSHFFTH